MQEQEKAGLEMIERQLMRLRGVNNVDEFDEEKIVLQTELGKLQLKGQHLHVTSLDVEHGSLQIDGIIDSFSYVEEKKKRARSKKQVGLLSRLRV